MKKAIYATGVFAAFFGLAGISEAVTGHGSITVSIIVFVIGFGICLWDLTEGREK